MSLRLGTGVLGNWDWLVVRGYGALLVIVGVSTSRRGAARLQHLFDRADRSGWSGLRHRHFGVRLRVDGGRQPGSILSIPAAVRAAQPRLHDAGVPRAA